MTNGRGMQCMSQTNHEGASAKSAVRARPWWGEPQGTTAKFQSRIAGIAREKRVGESVVRHRGVSVGWGRYVHQPRVVDMSEMKPHTRHVLIVDDDVDLADTLADLLSQEGHIVRVAHSGRAAMSVAAGFAFEVAIIDRTLPDMDAVQLIGSLRPFCGPRRTLFIAMTGYSAERAREESREAGFDEHLSKPFSVEDLDQAIALHSPESHSRPIPTVRRAGAGFGSDASRSDIDKV
jgi:CheY-like chemotaxis protein